MKKLLGAVATVAFAATGVLNPASAAESGEGNYHGGPTTGCSSRAFPVGADEGARLSARVSAFELRAKQQRFEGRFAMVRLTALDKVAKTPANPSGWEREAVSPWYVLRAGVARPHGNGFRSFFRLDGDRNPRLSVDTPFGDDEHYLRVTTRFLDADGGIEDVDFRLAGLCAATS